MSTETLPLSVFIQRQTSVYPILDRADVILERRGEANLVLMSNERYDALMDGLRFAARSLRPSHLR